MNLKSLTQPGGGFFPGLKASQSRGITGKTALTKNCEDYEKKYIKMKSKYPDL